MAFLKVFDPILSGMGTDWWFMQSLGKGLEGRVAIVDSVTCVNPFDRRKGGMREINRLQGADDRLAMWRLVQRQYHVRPTAHVEFSAVRKPWVRRWISLAFRAPLDWYAALRRGAWKAKHLPRAERRAGVRR